MTLARPSLDDVYLRHAGRAYVCMTSPLARPCQVTLRYLRALLRQPAFVVITLIQPLIWLLLFGALFKAVTQIPGFSGQLLHRLPDAGRRRDARGLERRLDRHGASSRT